MVTTTGDGELSRSVCRKSTVALALLMLGGLAACNNGAKQAATAPAAATLNFAKDGRQWPSTGGGYDGQRFSPLKQITMENVGQLGLAWVGDLDSHRGIEATPIVVDGVMYVTSTWSRVFAFDAKTGATLWSYDPEVDRAHARALCCDVVNRGVAVWDGRVYFGTLDGRLIALDAKTGKPDWQVRTADTTKPYSITGAPQVVKGMVLIGNGGADAGARGYLTAYDAKTGKQVWRSYVVPKGPKGPFENKAMADAAKTWPDDPVWTDVGGGGPWDPIAYDPDLNLIYVGTGNDGPWKRSRPDDQTDDLYTASLLALDPDTGEIVWHYQEVPGDRWDYDATGPMILATLRWDGKPRKVIMQAPKDGVFYVLDRETGELLAADKYGPATWLSHVDMKTGRPVLTDNADFTKQDRLIYPWPNGGHDWHPISFNPNTGLVYIPANDLPMVYSMHRGFRYFYDLGVPADELARMKEGQPEVKNGGYLRAWDPVARAAKWQVTLPTTWNSGTLSTAGGLVFQASGDGYFNAYEAATGERLAHIFTGNSAMAGPITYQIDDVQYVAIAAGYGGAGMLTTPDKAAVRDYENQGRVLVFKLGGGEVPLPPKRDVRLGPPQIDASAMPPMSDEMKAKGKALYGNCAGCHSTGGGTPMLPNLSRVHDIGEDGFKAILLDGMLQPNGMPSFKGRLSDDDVHVLYEFISRGLHNVPAAPFY